MSATACSRLSAALTRSISPMAFLFAEIRHVADKFGVGWMVLVAD
jgi:hypothetical protein